MAEINRVLALLRRQKTTLRNEIRRLVRMLMRLSPHRLALSSELRAPRRSNSRVTKFEIGGNVTRSIIFLPNVHLDGFDTRAIVGGIVIVVVVVGVATSTTPNPGKIALQPFVRGDAYHLDAVIAPFRAADPADKACSTFTQDFGDRLATAVGNHDAQNVTVWVPEQVAGIFPQVGADIQQFVENHQVDILFYGDIECNGQTATVRPQMMAPSLFYRGAPETAEFYSFDDMTSPLVVEFGNNSLEQVVRAQAARISTLIDLGRGFRLLATNSIDDLKQAAVLFQKLAAAGNVTDRHGLAMLQYLTGKSQLAGALDTCNTVDQNMLQQAENSFSKALLHEPEFALALAHLGNVSVYHTQNLPPDNSDQIQAALHKGLSRYQRALDARVQPADGLAAVIANIGIAQAEIVLHDLIPTSNESRLLLIDAVERLNDVIHNSAGAGKEIKAAVALAYALLGDVQRAGFNDERALASYGKVASLTEDRHLQMAVAQSLAELHTVRGDACTAAQQYLIAAQNACQTDSRKFAMQAERMQFYCQQANDAKAR